MITLETYRQVKAETRIKRDKLIYADWLNSMSIQELQDKYKLSDRTIRRAIKENSPKQHLV